MLTESGQVAAVSVDAVDSRGAEGGEARKGLAVPRVFSREGVDPFDAVEWEMRTAEITEPDGTVVFRQEGVEFPASWSQQATNIVASKYFYGDTASGNGSPGEGKREWSVRQLVGRVANTIADWGSRYGYFEPGMEADRFRDELASLCLGQYGSFNSPVWFNVGLFHQYNVEGPSNGYRYSPATGVAHKVVKAYEHPQASACFIGQVDDDMESIMDSAKTEAMLYKFGSGYGADLSTLRSSREKLAGGGKPSGPVSFFRLFDTVASIIKSGGKTRRAARMQTLKCWHPDIIEFIDSKVKEDRKARALIAAGYSEGMTGHPDEAYSSVMFQNTNIAVRLTDEFMQRATGEFKTDVPGLDSGSCYWTKAVTTGEPVELLDAREVLMRLSRNTWECGDPGVQFEDTIQRWHTLSNTAPIHSSNPCSEFMSINLSACNLASINLLRFLREDGTFDVKSYRAAVRIFIIAMDILVSAASYPTPEIAENAYKFRQLGLGYANLGALLMSWGIPYDSDDGRNIAGALTGILSGESYATSAEMAAVKGPFEGYAVNAEPMRYVMAMHRDAARIVADDMDQSGPDKGPVARVFNALPTALEQVWNKAKQLGAIHGYRNSQSCVIAPTGTIAFMMDCDTTGIEPELALVKFKKLSGGGRLKIVNRTVESALRALGYNAMQIGPLLRHVDTRGSIDDSPFLHAEHRPVFDCAFATGPDGRSLSWESHVKMLAAVQPFVSGSISKSVGLPATATPEDIRDAYILGWRLGLKCMAVYRDGSKGQQPLTTVQAEPAAPDAVAEPAPCAPCRERLTATRRSVTHKLDIQGHEGYATVGLYPDGRPGELFIRMAKEGSTVGGLMDALGTAVSLGLQYGVPLAVLVDKFSGSQYPPSGFTKNPDVPIARSLTDYIFRWMAMEFIAGYREEHAPVRDEHTVGTVPAIAAAKAARSDGNTCRECGNTLTRRAGSCWICEACGSTSGGCS